VVSAGWQDVCLNFHRKNPESRRICLESAQYLTRDLGRPDTIHVSECGNGLSDGLTPIFIDGMHVADVCIGQVLFSPMDERRFLKQARLYGYDEKAYMAAMKKVKIIDREKFTNVLACISEIAQLIADMGLAKIKAERSKLLEADNKRLEIEINNRRKAEKQLIESQRQYQFILDSLETIGEGLCIIDGEYCIRRMNKVVRQWFGDSIGQYCYRVFAKRDGPCPDCQISAIIEDGRSIRYQKKGRDGKIFDVLATPILNNDGTVSMMQVIRDVTEQKKAEESLMKAYDEVEKKVKERTAELEQANTALRVLLNQTHQAQQELEKNIVANIKSLIVPHLLELGTIVKDPRGQEYLKLIKENLEKVGGSFGRNLSLKAAALSPREIQVADFVKAGKSNKEIAELLGLSSRTVESYRDSLRKKLGIKNKKINLRSYLLSLT